MKPLTVVVVGGGFAAVQFARTLRKKLNRTAPSPGLFPSYGNGHGVVSSPAPGNFVGGTGRRECRRR